MTWLLEEPLPTIIAGVLAVAILGGLWIRTGRKGLVYALIAVVVAAVGLVLAEKWVVTYREQVDATLRQCAADVESNDLQAVLRHVHPQAEQIRLRVNSEFPKYHFREVRIARNLEITVNDQHDPPQALTRFNVAAVGSERGGLIANQRVLRYVEVTFQLDTDHEWRVIDYAHFDPLHGMRKSR
jgi:hypothetical protein